MKAKLFDPAVLIIIFGCLVLTGCITQEVHSVKYDHIKEEISAFAVTPTGDAVVIFGKTHHYVFENADLAEIVSQEFREHIQSIRLARFHVNEEQVTEGSVIFYTEEKLPSQVAAKAREIGFDDTSSFSDERLFYSLKLTGTRYQNNQLGSLDVVATRQPYQVNVNVPISAGEKAIRYASTPITVAADGAILLVGVPLVVLICLGNNDSCWQH